MAKIVEQLGEQPATENEALTFEGRPVTLNDAVFGVPESRTVVMLVAAVDDWRTVKSPGRTSEKSKFRLEPVGSESAATSVGFKATLEI